VPNPPRYPDDLRLAIAADIEALAGTPEGSVRAIARRHGVSKSLVGVIADEFGLTGRWAQGAQQTDEATKTRMTHVAAQRALAQEDIWDRFAELATQFHDEVTHLNVVKCVPEAIDDEDMNGFLAVERVERTTLPPGPADYRSMSTALAALTRAALDIARHDKGDEGTGQAIGLLDRFERGLREAREARERAKAEAAAAEVEAAEGS
jgi:transposase-like protein